MIQSSTRFFQVLETFSYRNGDEAHICGSKNSFDTYIYIVLSPSQGLQLGYNVGKTPMQNVIYKIVENIVL